MRSLRRQLGSLGTLSISIGVMSPTLGMSITGIQAARLLGRAAPLAYVVATIGVGFVAFGFVRLAREVASAGSVYAFVGYALGSRAGFVAGWALLGAYLIFPAVAILAVGVFGRAFLRSTGIAYDASWLPIALAAWAAVWVIASRQVRAAGRTLLGFELVSVALILVLMAIIVVTLIGGDAPQGQTVNARWLQLPPGTSASTVALAATFGFVSFAGFEAAGSFGEESVNPTRRIPRAIVIAVVFGGVFFVSCVAVQTLAFGTGPEGIRAFASTPAPLGELAQRYAGRGMADALNLAAIISALGAGLGSASVCGRMLFALSRDGLLPRPLGQVSSSTGVPGVGLAFVLLLDAAGLTAFSAAGTEPINALFYLATIGTLSLLSMYAFTNVATAVHLVRTGRAIEIVLPLAGLGVALYVLYHNVRPAPPPPFGVFPYVVAGWLILGIVLSAVLTPGPGPAPAAP
jgi:amino acid transporter